MLVWSAADCRPEIRALAFAPQHIRSFAFEYRNCVPGFRTDRAPATEFGTEGILPSLMLFFFLPLRSFRIGAGVPLQRIGWTPRSTRLPSTPDCSQ